MKTYIKKIADHRVRKDTLRNFGVLALLEILVVIILIKFGVINPEAINLMFGMLVNLIPGYFFSKYKDRSREHKTELPV